jgi:hypothetical protein
MASPYPTTPASVGGQCRLWTGGRYGHCTDEDQACEITGYRPPAQRMWYQSLLDLELHREFTEQGVVRAASLLDRDGGYEIALRDRNMCAYPSELTGSTSSRSPRDQEPSWRRLPSAATV